MLGDTAEKTKNPLKKAMRRRNAKTVQFTAPTYFEASEVEYSSDEDDGDELFGGADPTQAQAQNTDEAAEAEQEDGLQVQPLKVNGGKKDAKGATDEAARTSEEAAKGEGDKSRSSDEIFDRPMDPKVSRNGTMRNTDSFFKDDNAETRKITLTPNLLRDDSSTSTTGSRERGPSLESLEKNGFADKVKDDKKKKDKKPGMLSGLFKRKEKKPKGSAGLDSFDSDAEKQSEEFGRNSPQAKESTEVTVDRPWTEQPALESPQRAPSKGKLQKPQRSRDESPSKATKGILKTESSEAVAAQNTAREAPSSKPAAQPVAPASTMRLVAPEQQESPKQSTEERITSPVNRSRSNSSASKLNPINMLKSQPSNDEPRPEKVKKAKQRVQLDDFDSEEGEKNDPFADPTSASTGAQAEPESSGRLSESPVQISAADAQPPGKEATQEKELDQDSQQLPGLTADTSSQETPSPVSTPSPSASPSTSAPPKPHLSASQPISSPSPTSAIPPPSRPAPVPTKEMEMSPPVSAESSTLPAWSDSSLRTYLDDGSDIRDMLVCINDTTGVVPVGPEHPIMSQLFKEETRAVTRLGGELDNLLNNWIETKKKKQKGLFPVKQPTR